jgi:fumarate reductase subunit D
MSTPLRSSQLPGNQVRVIALTLAAFLLLIVLIFFKFIPDIGTGYIQGTPSSLSVWAAFDDYYMTPNKIFYPRFLGNVILRGMAGIIDPHVHSTDQRLHPLRIAATLLTALYFLIGLIPAFLLPRQIDWRVFMSTYGFMFISGLYVFYPCDAPAIAFLSLGLAALLVDSLALALVCLLITGLFRESAFHFTVLFLFWALSRRDKPVIKRVGWLVASCILFVLEFKIIRYYYPAPSTGSEQMLLRLIYNYKDILLGGGFWSLTTVATLSLGLLFPFGYLLLANRNDQTWTNRFFLLNCLAFPFWIVFYRIQGGNISEFRMLWPVILPYVYGMAWRANDATTPQ